MKKIVKGFVLFVIFCLITGSFAYFTLTFIIKNEYSVVVPDIVGRDVIYSLELLTDLGLNTKIRGSEYNHSVPKNYVIFGHVVEGMEVVDKIATAPVEMSLSGEKSRPISPVMVKSAVVTTE